MSLSVPVLLALLGGLGAAQVIAAADIAAPVPAGPTCQAPSAPLSEAQRKFHPGHYVNVGKAALPDAIKGVLSKGVAGVQVRYRWADLEPEQGQYQFAAVARDLEAAKNAGTQLVAMIEDKSFTGESPTPTYLQARYTLHNNNQGYTAIRWDPFVGEQMKKLIARLGAQFDCDPHFEGVAFQESSLGLDDKVLDASGYTPEKYRDALIGQLRSAATSMPTSRVFWYMNFLPHNQRYIGEVASAVIGTGVVMGGPDVLPDNEALARRTYPYYGEFRGRLKLFNSMQHNSYRHRHGGGEDSSQGYWSMEALFEFARDKLHVDYLFWDYHTRRVPPDSNDWDDAREVIAKHPTLGP